MTANTLTAAWEKVGFEDAQRVEDLLMRGAVVGGLGGAAGAVIGHQVQRGAGFVGALCVAALLSLLVVPRLSLGQVLGLAGAVLVAPIFVPWKSSTLPFFFTAQLGIALALEAMPWWRRLMALVGPSLGAAWFLWVEHALSSRHLGSAAPVLSGVAVLGAGLFLAVGASLAWVSFSFDQVEHALAAQPKARQAWLRVRTALGRLPKGATHTRLEAAAQAGAQRCLQARADHEAAVASLDVQAETEAREAVEALTDRLSRADDAELRAHLQQLLRVHKDTLEQLEGLKRKIDRTEARLAAETGWLDTAAFSLELAPKNEPGLIDVCARLEKLHAH